MRFVSFWGAEAPERDGDKLNGDAEGVEEDSRTAMKLYHRYICGWRRKIDTNQLKFLDMRITTEIATLQWVVVVVIQLTLLLFYVYIGS